MKEQVSVLDQYSLYTVIFLVESEFRQKIEKNIICPIHYNDEEIKKVIFQKFNRVKEIIKIYKIDECTKLDSKAGLKSELV